MHVEYRKQGRSYLLRLPSTRRRSQLEDWRSSTGRHLLDVEDPVRGVRITAIARPRPEVLQRIGLREVCKRLVRVKTSRRSGGPMSSGAPLSSTRGRNIGGG